MFLCSLWASVWPSRVVMKSQPSPLLLPKKHSRVEGNSDAPVGLPSAPAQSKPIIAGSILVPVALSPRSPSAAVFFGIWIDFCLPSSSLSSLSSPPHLLALLALLTLLLHPSSLPSPLYPLPSLPPSFSPSPSQHTFLRGAMMCGSSVLKK